VFSLAEECFKKAQDFNSLLLFYSSIGDEEGLEYLLEASETSGKYNVAYQSAYLLAKPERCVDILMAAKRYSEAAMFARAYCPAEISRVHVEWSSVLKASALPFLPIDIE
jgi:coatomer subunit beta'